MKLLFKIEKIVPARMPGAELAAYMTSLARLLGSREYVHFTAIRNESTGIEAHIGVKGTHLVRQRMRAVESVSSPIEIRRNWDEINGMLARRKTSAMLQELRNDGTRINRVIFPGTEAGKPEMPAIRDHVQVQGLFYRIEGRDKTVHVGLQDGDRLYSVVVTREQAKEIARSAMFDLVRVEGSALLTRSPDGTWETGEIEATRIEPLTDIPLSETLQELQDAGGFGWSEETDALAALEEIRSGQ